MCLGFIRPHHPYAQSVNAALSYACHTYSMVVFLLCMCWAQK